MITHLLIGWSLMAVCVVVHATGLTGAFRWVARQALPEEAGFWPPTWLLIRIAGWLIGIHLVEIAVWAMAYWGLRCFPDAESAFYFAGVTYTTVGYGDLVLPTEWRLLGPIEGLTGILMCGLSTGFFFTVVSRMYASWLVAREK